MTEKAACCELFTTFKSDDRRAFKEKHSAKWATLSTYVEKLEFFKGTSEKPHSAHDEVHAEKHESAIKECKDTTSTCAELPEKSRMEKKEKRACCQFFTKFKDPEARD